MSGGSQEGSIWQRVSERPSVDLGKVRGVRKRDLGYRFVAGALTSIVAGVLTLAIGPRVGGIMLAFPAILAASLTLIAREEDVGDAREDSRGAIVGGCALAGFAAVCAVAFTHWNPAVVLAVATGAWTAGALLGYAVAWFR